MNIQKPLILALSIIFASLFGLHTLANETGNKNMIRMTTSLGDIEIELYPDDAPETVKNFLSYVESGHFDGLVFHRVIPGFMIQGGGFTPDNAFLDFTAKTQQGWGYAVFAKVVEGMDVVKQIGGIATGNVGGHGDVPLEPVYIEKAEVISE